MTSSTLGIVNINLCYYSLTELLRLAGAGEAEPFASELQLLTAWGSDPFCSELQCWDLNPIIESFNHSLSSEDSHTRTLIGYRGVLTSVGLKSCSRLIQSSRLIQKLIKTN